MRHYGRVANAVGAYSAFGVDGAVAEAGIGDSVSVAVQSCGESFGGAC